ncbi:MAG: hypothetical protein KA765_06350 [Thermoflexales bacterium]|nr:hypothetical protein [Thermoflexales bacterium]
MSLTPTISPSLVPAVSPSLTPSSAPTLIPDQPIPEPALLPALETTLDLGTRGMTDDWHLQHAIALDEQNQRVYVSTSVSKTVVLDAETLTPIGEIEAGGSVAVLPERDKLYIGVAGMIYYDGVTPNVPAELRVYDASTLAFRRSAWFSDTSSSPPLAVPDPQTGRVYVVHQGVYIADADSLDITGNLSGTLPMPGTMGYSLFAVDAVIDPARQRLFVSLNNGIPGSNNGNILYVYDLTSGQLINHDYERSISGLALDLTTGTAFAPRSRMNGAAIVKYDAQGGALRRLDGANGKIKIDPIHDLAYALSAYPRRLGVFDRDLNYGGEVAIDQSLGLVDFAVDAERDRLLMLTNAGHLQVWRGHGRALRDQPSLPVPSRGAVQWIVPSPDFGRDRVVMAAFSPDENGSGFGSVFVNRDDDQTWQLLAGLPITNSAAALVFSPDFATDRTVLVGLSTYYGGSGVYRSTDGGQTWQSASRGLTDLSINRLVISPDFKADRTVFAVGARGGLYRSTAGGDSWVSLADRYRTDPNAQAALTALALSPNFARDGRLLMGQMSGLGGTWLSRDRGETWRKVLAEPSTRLAYLADAQTVYAVLSNGSVARSDDGGESWTAASDGLETAPGAMLDLGTGADFALLWVNRYEQPVRLFYRPVKDLPWHEVGATDQPWGTIFAMAKDGTLFTGDTRGTVQRYAMADLASKPVPARRVSDLPVQAIAIARTGAGNETLISGGSFGVWASFDLDNWFDTQFADRHTINPPQVIASPAYDQDGTLFATVGQGVYRSRGKPWRWELLPIDSDSLIGSLAISPNFATNQTLLVAGDYRAPKLMASTDAGDTWASIAPPIEITQSVTMRMAIGPDDVWWTWIDYAGLYRSADRGQSWSQLIARSDAMAQSMVFSPDYARDGVIWIGLLYGTIYKSNDFGQTWNAAPGGLPIDPVWSRSIVFSPDFGRDRTIYIGTDNGLFRSIDAGATWARIDGGLPAPKTGQQVIMAVAISPAFATDNTLLVATADGGLSISRDRGDTWTVVDQ